MKKVFVSGMATMICCVLLLTITACIPRNLIQKNSEQSAEYFAKQGLFPTLIGNYINSVQDNYSDNTLCNIIYCVDTTHPFTSTILAKYAQAENESSIEGYLFAVRGEEEPNQEYGRYWHGTSVILRPLLMVMSIRYIRILFGILGTVTYLISTLLIAKKGNTPFAVCSVIAFILVEPWMFFTSLEYATAFTTASVATLLLLIFDSRKKEFDTLPFFVAVGVVTCFVDFLTTETLTFTLPMLMLFAKQTICGNTENSRTNELRTKKEGLVFVIKNGFCWLLGYASMFALKIAFLAVFAGSDVTSESLKEGAFRLAGETRLGNMNIAPTTDYVGKLSGAIWHNLACLYPIETGVMRASQAMVPTVIILVVGFALVYLLRDKIEGHIFGPMALVALLPYLRFIVLANHSYIHFFITYRAQLVSILVFIYFVYKNALFRFSNLIARRRKPDKKIGGKK
ncbi:MAG: hypothetical protein K6F37_06330 [Lachnospiraceae bacterium]|nr:hypothetical protein [Lachnospiraceae bacterium]